MRENNNMKKFLMKIEIMKKKIKKFANNAKNHYNFIKVNQKKNN